MSDAHRPAEAATRNRGGSEPTIFPLILSGGSGTRLWPVSRANHPKQFLPLTGRYSLFEETVRRIADQGRFARPTIVCNQDHRFMALDQARRHGADPRAVILEPAARNTAAAVTVAALSIAQSSPHGLLLVLPSDQMIRDGAAFRVALEACAPLAQSGRLMTFGLQPSRAETGFGYIEVGAALEGGPCHEVRRFIEKPDATRAQAFVAGGRHVWNSGLFLFRADALLGEMQRYEPQLVEQCRTALAAATPDLDFLRLEATAFAAAKSISVDHAVMERTDRAAVLPCEIGWSDLGSWQALWEATERDGAANALQGDVFALDSEGCLVHSNHRLVATVGLRDTVVVETDSAVLVAPRSRSQDVKAVAEALLRAGRSEAREHSTAHRPWGSYRTADRGAGFAVKRITVKPGGGLSLQVHEHRSEHWVVVRGEARVTRGTETILLGENQSTYIPAGVPHRLENAGREELSVIEVECGPSVDENDVVRLEGPLNRR